MSLLSQLNYRKAGMKLQEFSLTEDNKVLSTKSGGNLFFRWNGRDNVSDICFIKKKELSIFGKIMSILLIIIFSSLVIGLIVGALESYGVEEPLFYITGALVSFIMLIYVIGLFGKQLTLGYTDGFAVKYKTKKYASSDGDKITELLTNTPYAKFKVFPTKRGFFSINQTVNYVNTQKITGYSNEFGASKIVFLVLLISLIALIVFLGKDEGILFGFNAVFWFLIFLFSFEGKSLIRTIGGHIVSVGNIPIDDLQKRLEE